MKIVILEGSPNSHGSSNMLADSFIRGAEEAGHTVKVIDAAHADIHPCTGCIHCGYEGPCVQEDDMEKFRGDILKADMMVFVTAGFTVQNKKSQIVLNTSINSSSYVSFSILPMIYQYFWRVRLAKNKPE